MFHLHICGKRNGVHYKGLKNMNLTTCFKTNNSLECNLRIKNSITVNVITYPTSDQHQVSHSD